MPAKHTIPPFRIRAALTAAALFFLALWPPARAAEPVPAERARQALADSARARNLQTELPLDPKNMMRESGGPRGRSGGGSEANPGVSQVVADYLLWISLAVFLAVLLFALRDNLRAAGGREEPGRKKAGGAARTAEQARLAEAQAEADGMAGAGSFAEAMHVLLLQSLGEMRRRLGVPIALSLTSREILGSVRLSPEARAALADIVGRVEVSYFGRHEPGREEYAACRDSYARLVALLGREAAA